MTVTFNLVKPSETAKPSQSDACVLPHPCALSDADVKVCMVTVEAVATGLQKLGFDNSFLASQGFEGKADQTLSQPSEGGILGLVGIGKAASADTASFRRAGAAVANTWRRCSHVAVCSSSCAGDIAASLQAFAEGVVLGAYQYSAFKSEPDTTMQLKHVDVVMCCDDETDGTETDGAADVDIDSVDIDSAVEALNRGRVIAEAVCFARDLVNEPGGSLTPQVFADKAVDIAEKCGLSVEVWGKEKITAERLGGVLGVNRGSTLPPRFVRLTYTPESHKYTPESHKAQPHAAQSNKVDETAQSDKADDTGVKSEVESSVKSGVKKLALVGKGVTFDSGGLSIKTAQGMVTMKCDMSGAAAVLATMSLLSFTSPQVVVEAYIPLTDNMLGGDATRPGDVLTIRNGKTIEIANTDAEGRLILADALSLASEDQPDAIINLATLTGACVVALGKSIAGLMGNNQAWVEQVLTAAKNSDERVWHLPLPSDYEKQFKSDVADMKNIGTAYGGALTAGLILQKFVGENIPWAHLDIAGPAMAESDNGEINKGGTGFGVRLLVELISNFNMS